MDKMDLRTRAERIRRKFGEDLSSPIDIFSLVKGIDRLTLVFYPLGQNISGACIKRPTSMVIALNSVMTLGRQRFTLAHELYHLFFDDDMETTICPTKIDSGDKIEREADRFASYLLIPPVALDEQLQSSDSNSDQKLCIDEVVRLEQYFGVSRKAMLFRLQEEHFITKDEALGMESNVIMSASRRGYDTSLYRPLPDDQLRKTLGYYITKAEQLYAEEKISTGKYEEFLLDAFRDDIVYGTEGDEPEYVD